MDLTFWKKRKSFCLEDYPCVSGEKFLFSEIKTFVRNGKQVQEEVLNHAFLRLDPDGYIVYWTLEEKPTAFYYLFVDELIDVRILNHKESTQRADGYVTLQFVPNKDYTHFEFISFLHPSKKLVTEWSEFLFSWVYKQKKMYHNQLYYIKKLATPRIYGGSRILFNQYRQSVLRENKVIDTLFGTTLKDYAGRNKGLSDSEAVELYLSVVDRSEMKSVFDIWTSKTDVMSPEDFVKFLNKSQRDPRLNEDLYLPKTLGQAQKIIKELEDKEELTFVGFVRYLLSEQNADLSSSTMALKPELMGNPISHYYINSSHNSYLLGNQVILAKFLPDNDEQECRTDTEMYRQILLSGARCVELDVWESAEGPVITHGPIALQKINVVPLEEVCEAIVETAFKTSEYPVVLSIENHCKGEQQRKMSEIFKRVFGEYLQIDPLAEFPLLGNQHGYLPPPIALKNKILLKGSRGDFGRIPGSPDQRKKHMTVFKEHLPVTITETVEKIKDTTTTMISEKHDNGELVLKKCTRIEKLTKEHKKKLLLMNQSLSIPETEGTLKDLINYFQTTPKIHVDDPYFWMHSGNEEKIDKDIQKNSNLVIKHTIRHIVRVYPDHKRIDSDNFYPTFFWTGGCQMIAMNYQTKGVAMQLNDALFEENGRCGYVPKPDIMNIPNTKLSVYDSNFLVANRVEISVISAQCLSLLAPGVAATQVIVDLYDLPKDTVRGKHRTATAVANGMNTVYKKNNLVFHKVIKPQHAMLYIRVVEAVDASVVEKLKSQKKVKEDKIQPTIGHRILPVHHLTQGYRHITLRTFGDKPFGPASVFVKINVQTYVPDSQVAIRRQFTEPIQVKVEAEQSKHGFEDPLQARKDSISNRDDSKSALAVSFFDEKYVDEVYV